MAWRQLLDIAKDNRDTWRAKSRQSPSDCPRCGYPLNTNKQGTIIHCPMGDFTAYKGTVGSY